MRFAVSFLLCCCAVGSFANAKGDIILRQIDALTAPQMDKARQADRAYVKAFSAEYEEYQRQKNDLIYRLYQADPNNPRTADLMEERWSRFTGAPLSDLKVYMAALHADMDQVLSERPPKQIVEVIDFLRTMNDSVTARTSFMAEANGFLAKYPTSKWAPQLLFEGSFAASREDKLTLYHKILEQFPNCEYIQKVKAGLAQFDSIGKPFTLSFADAIGGKQVDVSTMKGKVVLIDFWATWCHPCVGEMPHVKEIYKQYHEKGLEIVGVSMDHPEAAGGLAKLREFVAKNQIEWPMYYEGQDWDGKFSSSWGIYSIPAMFLVDKQGNFRGPVDPREPGFQATLEKYLAE